MDTKDMSSTVIVANFVHTHTHTMLANSETRMQICKGQRETKWVKSANFIASIVQIWKLFRITHTDNAQKVIH